MTKQDNSNFVDVGCMESEIYEPAPEIKDEFEAAAGLGNHQQALRAGLLQPVEGGFSELGVRGETEPVESAVGEESVGGGNPTPDQDIVEELGEAMGLTYQDGEPLGGEAKLRWRDTHRWELNPASSDEFQHGPRRLSLYRL